MPFKVGRIDFINTAPVYAGADAGRVVFAGEEVCGSPAELSLMLRDGHLAMSSVSAVEFAYSHPQLLIIPGISISCTGPVRSVLLYSSAPLSACSGTIGLTHRSATARALVRVIIEDYFERKVAYRNVDMEPVSRERNLDALPADLSGLLVIGNDALALPLEQRFPFVLDLGAFWVERTGHPFVFGLWAARRDFAREYPESVEAFRAGLLRSLGHGLKEMDAVARRAAEKSGFPEEQVRAYLQHIDYCLGPHHLAGLRTFFDILKGRGEIRGDVELEFFERPRERASHA